MSKEILAPKLSVVVPTRERSDTLFYTIKTLVDQDYQFCEFIISDNDSNDNTKEVVESFSDSRIRYINTGRRVSMSENWEFALGHVKGDFVTYIGDDDGFVSGALAKAMGIIVEFRTNALVWHKIDYCWPDHIDENSRNLFWFGTEDSALKKVRALSTLKKVIRFQEMYTKLPCLYNGIVRKSFVDKIKKLSVNGVFFNAISPDIFSGIALSSIIGNYLYTNYSFSVNGASRHSNGTSFVRSVDKEAGTPFAKFMSENLIEYDPRLKMAPCPSVCVMGEYLLAKKYIHLLKFSEPSWKKYVKILVRNAKCSYASDEILRSAAHTVSAVGGRTRIPDRAAASITISKRLGFQLGSWQFKAPNDMVNNIYDACRLAGSMQSEVIQKDSQNPVQRFVVNIRNFLLYELKKLYRSY
ncbi:glycosyltransferase family 2 protein [Desulfoluna spongiiphila]|uniref:Glycosyl transferase family 2 n=1 Tax=Desulfoluna spongiiphila TaxID=419481 RepID=A0A1G5JFI6_9BACT|nr:glycosyltransferase family 2 protein [Desulfoluna spongiiphila]SCY87057.1 Glycosyl transferase family 2 [Desulfoluna spongiiphila]